MRINSSSSKSGDNRHAQHNQKIEESINSTQVVKQRSTRSTYFWRFLICIPANKNWIVIFNQRRIWWNHCVAADRKNLHENSPFCDRKRFEGLKKMAPKLSLPWKRTALKGRPGPQSFPV